MTFRLKEPFRRVRFGAPPINFRNVAVGSCAGRRSFDGRTSLQRLKLFPARAGDVGRDCGLPDLVAQSRLIGPRTASRDEGIDRRVSIA